MSKNQDILKKFLYLNKDEIDSLKDDSPQLYDAINSVLDRMKTTLSISDEIQQPQKIEHVEKKVIETTSSTPISTIKSSYKPKRPSPSDSATAYEKGWNKIGNDGLMYTVSQPGEVKRWVKTQTAPTAFNIKERLTEIRDSLNYMDGEEKDYYQTQYYLLESLLPKDETISGPELKIDKTVAKGDAEERDFYVLNTNSSLNTIKPTDNEYFDMNLTYILIKMDKSSKPILLSGSGEPSAYFEMFKREGYYPGQKYVPEKGYSTPKIGLWDDGNKTTRFPSEYRGRFMKSFYESTQAQWYYIGKGSELKKFPKGTYKLYVMK